MKNKLLKTFKGKKILVTGGTGSIGSEVVRQLLPLEPEQIRIYTRDETKQFYFQHELKKLNADIDVRFLLGDIRDKNRLSMALGDIDIIFHAAALKHVSFCEYNPFEAIKTNIEGTQNIIDLAIKHKVDKVIGISSDKAVNPVNIMGVTKLLMEKIFLSTRWYLGLAETKFSVVRFGNVLDSRGSATQLWKQQIQEGGPLTITDPAMTRYFMTIQDAVKLIFKAATMMQGQEIFILKMPKRKIIDLAMETLARDAKGKVISIKVTGKIDGEKVHEQLFTDEEKKALIETKDIYILIPYRDIFKSRNRRFYHV